MEPRYRCIPTWAALRGHMCGGASAASWKGKEWRGWLTALWSCAAYWWISSRVRSKVAVGKRRKPCMAIAASLREARYRHKSKVSRRRRKKERTQERKEQNHMPGDGKRKDITSRLPYPAQASAVYKQSSKVSSVI